MESGPREHGDRANAGNDLEMARTGPTERTGDGNGFPETRFASHGLFSTTAQGKNGAVVLGSVLRRD
jgi:hypothetical protein